MRTFLKWTVAAVSLAACGGNVVVDSPNGGSATTTLTEVTTSSCEGCTANGGGTTIMPTGGSTTTTVNTTTVSTSSGSTGCISCETWASSGGPSSEICPGNSVTAYKELNLCTCAGGACATSCEFNFCLGQSIAGSCGSCIMTSCAMQYTFCQQN